MQIKEARRCNYGPQLDQISDKPGLTHPIVQELCESRGGRPGLSVLTSLMVSVDVKHY